jgi:Holliday junction resolvasome RuvABC endonuclease subunit
MNIIGIDHGFASTGICIVHTDPSCAPRGQALTRYVGTDSKDSNENRVRIIGRAVHSATTGAVACIIESLSLPGVGKGEGGERIPRNPAIAAKCGMAYGACVASAQCPVFILTPQKVRKLLGLPKNAPKSAVKAMVLATWPSIIPGLPRAQGQHEHLFDAAGLVLAWLKTDEAQTIMRIAGGA